MRTFAGIEEKFATFKDASVLLQPVPYDGTSTWGKGADKGFKAFLEAAENMEIYDIETDSEVFRRGIHLFDPICRETTPDVMFNEVYARTKELLGTGKFLTFLGGEHSVSIGIIKAFYEKYPGISILQLDAHTDLRPSYLGTPYNHACALFDATRNTNVVQVGIRSMDTEEKQYLQRDHCFFAEDMFGQEKWMQEAMGLLGEKVYITFDLDAFDPSIMPATGTPEPGGLLWNPVLKFLKMVFRQRDVLGFDIVELAPIDGIRAPEFLVAKLYYKMLSYKFELQ